MSSVDLRVHDDANQAAEAAAEYLARAIVAANHERGRACVAVSGGSTPGHMFRGLARHTLPWSTLHIFQVDERVAVDGHSERNLTGLLDSMAHAGRDALQRIDAMQVTATDLDTACRVYARDIEAVAGDPPVLDVVHLGLGEDGHTASLVPGDSALDVRDRSVVMTGAEYQGRRRMTLTFPVLEGARCLLWLACGAGKAVMLKKLMAGDRSIPAGRLPLDRAVIFTDKAASGG